MCTEFQPGDPVIWVAPGDARKHSATIVGDETFGVGGAIDHPTNPRQEFGGMEVWPGYAEAEGVRLFRIHVQGEEGTRVVPLMQLRPASERER